MVLSRQKFCDSNSGAVVLQQYSEFSSYFRQKWLSQSDQLPVIDDIVQLWITYPQWQRCPELRVVFNIVVWFSEESVQCGNSGITYY